MLQGDGPCIALEVNAPQRSRLLSTVSSLLHSHKDCCRAIMQEHADSAKRGTQAMRSCTASKIAFQTDFLIVQVCNVVESTTTSLLIVANPSLERIGQPKGAPEIADAILPRPPPLVMALKGLPEPPPPMLLHNERISMKL